MASETNHPWCRDTARDEAVRAAEDAAAVPSIQHRDLPEVVAALTERVARLEAAQATLGIGDVFARLTGGEQEPPRGWLTEEERGALERAFDLLCDDDGDQPLAGTVQRLLARSTPPRVKRPNPNVVITTADARERIDRQWIAAIRAAGGEVAE